MSAETIVWCLLIDHDHKPTFGEPFPVSIRLVDTIHELKIRICAEQRSFTTQTVPNCMEIWKFKSSSLSAKESFDETEVKILRISSTWSNQVQHLGVALKVKELELRINEILLAVIPRNGARCLFLCSTSFPELSTSPIVQWNP